VGPDRRALLSECEKLALYVGDRGTATAADVAAIVTRGKHARAFALGDALGDRNLPTLLRCLDEELWTMRGDKGRSIIGLLYGLVSKMRSLLFAREMIDAGWIRAGGRYPDFKPQLERVPADAFPKDRRINPLSLNPYVLFRAAGQAGNWTRDELIRALDLLLTCNRRLVSSSLDDAFLLQQTLTQIFAREKAATR
jgi:DNA polymerase III delta subunit